VLFERGSSVRRTGLGSSWGSGAVGEHDPAEQSHQDRAAGAHHEATDQAGHSRRVGHPVGPQREGDGEGDPDDQRDESRDRCDPTGVEQSVDAPGARLLVVAVVSPAKSG
jgi:hypothetical protein